MTSTMEKNCTLLIYANRGIDTPSEVQLMKQLESKDVEEKITAMKTIVVNMVNGETYPKLLMPIIKFALHTDNHFIKKMLLLYWEIVEKKNKEGKLLQEMILVVNAMKNNLQHPNEYIRGCTLRFLCKMREPEILESLIPSIIANLTHRHSYVRKNAVLTVFSIFESCPDLIPDASEHIEEFLKNELNPAAKRNAFMFLYNADHERAMNYLNGIINTVPSMGESFQLVVLELIRKIAKQGLQNKTLYIKCIYAMISSTSAAVSFDGSNTLIALTSAPTAVRAAVSSFCRLLVTVSDHNVKLIILNKLISLKVKHKAILQEMIMDILKVLASPDNDIRRKALALCLEIVNLRTSEQVVQLLKKELLTVQARITTRAQQKEELGRDANDDAYTKALVDSLHTCAVKFPEVVGMVVPSLMYYLSDDSQGSALALDVIFFLREIVEDHKHIRTDTLNRIMDAMDQVKHADVLRVALWILGEYATETDMIQKVLATVHGLIGEDTVLTDHELTNTLKDAAERKEEEESKQKAKQDTPQRGKKAHDAAGKDSAKTKTAGPQVLADGTYAQQSASSHLAETLSGGGASASSSGAPFAPGGAPFLSHLRSFLEGGNFFLGAGLSSAMTKLLLRLRSSTVDVQEVNAEIAWGLLLFISMLRLGSHKDATKPIDNDTFQRIYSCVRVLLMPDSTVEVFGNCRESFNTMLLDQRKRVQEMGGLLADPVIQSKVSKEAETEFLKQADDLIFIRHLKAKVAGGASADTAGEDVYDDDDDVIKAATGESQDSRKLDGSKEGISKLHRIFQLTGFSDPVYCEALVTVLEYDLMVEFTVMNQTNTTLQNLSVELTTTPDLKLVDRPTSYNVAAGASQRIRANVKVTSTESGIIFGNIIFDEKGTQEKVVIVLQSIHMDIMDYITPASCSDSQFRSMWAEFEWENKVAVMTEITDLNQYLQHIMNITNMRCMTAPKALGGSCSFLAANLYAKSIFGEDALMNLSIELQKTGKITGYIRIRTKMQGIALSLGDKIQSKQRVATGEKK